ncbi:hypothetical protein GGF38_005412, partial [Coemansia sp. RSA 25]
VIRGLVSMKVNDQRSYDITARIIALEEDEAEAIITDEALCVLLDSQKSRSREALWYLHEQTYNYAYVGEPIEPAKPENANLYLPVESLLAESSSTAAFTQRLPPAASHASQVSSVQGVADSLTDFIVTSTTASDQDPNAMQY